MPSPRYRFYVRNANLQRVGEIDAFTAFTATLHFNGVGSWQLVVPHDVPALAEIDFRSGILVYRDDMLLLSGPIRSIERQWSADGDVVTLSGADDNYWLSTRLALPEPTGNFAAQAYHVVSGPGESVLIAYVNANLGPGALPERRLAGLVMAADQGRGSTVTGRARFDNLLSLCQEIALAAGDLGFRIIQSGTTLRFEVYVPQDRTNSAVFSAGRGTLQAFAYSLDAATVNYVYVGGQGEGAARQIVQYGRPSSQLRFGRIEQFRDRRDTNQTTELFQSAIEQVTQGSERMQLQYTPIAASSLLYGVHYQLGDRVTVLVDTIPVREVIRSLQIRLSGEQPEELQPVIATPQVGGEGEALWTDLITRVRAVNRRVSRLERVV